MLGGVRATTNSTAKLSAAAVCAALTLLAAGCGDSGPAAPSSVPAGAIASIGSGGDTVTKARFERFLSSQLSGKSPLGGSIAGSIPIDPPTFHKCAAALAANDAKNKTPKHSAAELKANCVSQYKQTRDAVEGQLITYQWLIAEAKARSLTASPDEVKQILSQYINAGSVTSKAKRQAQLKFNAALKASGLESGDLNSQLQAQILQGKISQAAIKEAGDPSKLKPADMQRIQIELANSIQRKWRAATLCAKGFTVAQCSNGPQLPDLKLPKQG